MNQEHKALSEFDLYEIGAVADQATFIEAQWRRDTRPKKMRSNSAEEITKQRRIDHRVHMLDSASFDTSSHHTIDYLLEACSAKSFTFGKDGRYPHLKKQRPVKRSLSAGNFNWNMLVDRVNQRFAKEAKIQEAMTSALPLNKLNEILGQDVVAKIKEELPALFEKLVEYVKQKKEMTYAFCKEVLEKYGFYLDEDKKVRMM